MFNSDVYSSKNPKFGAISSKMLIWLTALDKRDNVSLCSKEQVCLLCSKFKLISHSRGKFRPLFYLFYKIQLPQVEGSSPVMQQ
jgi:hypothetical protein